jgi:hypothetical protein
MAALTSAPAMIAAHAMLALAIGGLLALTPGVGTRQTAKARIARPRSRLSR